MRVCTCAVCVRAYMRVCAYVWNGQLAYKSWQNAKLLGESKMGYHWHVVVSRIRALRADIYKLDVCFYSTCIILTMWVLSRIKSCHLNRHQCFGECLYLAWIDCAHEIMAVLVSQHTKFSDLIAPTWERYTGCIGEASYLVWPFIRASMGHKAMVWGHWQAGYPVQFCGEIKVTVGMMKRVSVLVLPMAKNVMAEQGTAIMTASSKMLMMMVTTPAVVMIMI